MTSTTYSPAFEDMDQLRQRLADLEVELHELRLSADSAARAKSEFLSNMSHELRTPLNAILGFSGRLLGDALEEDQLVKVRYIHDSATSLLELINDILTFAKIEVGDLPIFPLRFDLQTLLDEVFAHVGGLAHAKRLQLSIDVSEGVPEVLFSDRARIRQVLVNLVGNAVKFTDRGEVILKVRRIADSGQRMCLRFEVRDTGPGIPPERLSRLIAPFAQGDGSVTRAHNGTGLGLSLCRRLAELLGAELGIESKVGDGTRVRFDLWTDPPVERPASPAANSPSAERPPELPNQTNRPARPAREKTASPPKKPQPNRSIKPRLQKRPRVLIVDDDRLCRLLLEEMLSPWADCQLAADGYEALRRFEEALDSHMPYELVCLDIMMPGLDGHGVLERIRRIEEDRGTTGSSGTKVVMTTALRESQHCLAAFREGCEAYVTKPINEDELFQRLKELEILI